MKKLLITLSLILFATVIYASEVTVNTNIDKTNITIGDPVKISVAISYPNEFLLATVNKPSEIGQWSCINLTTSTKKTNNLITSLAHFELICFSTGTTIIPPIALTLTKSPYETYTIFSDSKSVTIESTLAKIGDLGDIKDIKEPLSIKGNVLIYILIISVLLLLIIFYIYHRNKNLIQEVLDTKPKIPPYQLALEELDELMKSDILSKGFIKEYYIRLSEIMRNYISGTFAIETLEKTTQEICNDLKVKSSDKKITTKIRELFENCDLVKFAKFTPNEAQCIYDIEVAKTIVLESMPKETQATDNVSNESNIWYFLTHIFYF